MLCGHLRVACAISIVAICIPTALIAAPAQSSYKPPTLKLQCPGSFEPAKLSGICQSVADHDFSYNTMIEGASCVAKTDSASVKARKIQAMWKESQKFLTCNHATAFGIKDGNILKYAVKMETWDFLTSAAIDWKVELNAIDPADSRTVLDYIRDEVKLKPIGSKMSRNLQDYYWILRSAGAMHREELP